MSTIKCPACGEQLELDDAYRDWTVRCPHCSSEFVPSEQDNRGIRKSQLPVQDEEDYDYDNDRNLDRHEALQLVAGPGLWLEICGWGGALLIVLGIVLMILAALAQQNNGNGDPGGLIFLSCCLGVFGLPYSVLMAIGGRHMRTIRSYTWAMTGAIMGIVALPLFGCAVIQAGIGIWALVTLQNPIVRRAFDSPRRRSRRDRDWDDGW